MKTYKVISGEGYGKTSDVNIREAIECYKVKCEIVGGEYEGYGNREYSIIETEEPIYSEFIQSLAYNMKVIEL